MLASFEAMVSALRYSARRLDKMLGTLAFRLARRRRLRRCWRVDEPGSSTTVAIRELQRGEIRRLHVRAGFSEGQGGEARRVPAATSSSLSTVSRLRLESFATPGGGSADQKVERKVGNKNVSSCAPCDGTKSSNVGGPRPVRGKCMKGVKSWDAANSPISSAKKSSSSPSSSSDPKTTASAASSIRSTAKDAKSSSAWRTRSWSRQEDLVQMKPS